MWRKWSPFTPSGCCTCYVILVVICFCLVVGIGNYHSNICFNAHDEDFCEGLDQELCRESHDTDYCSDYIQGKIEPFYVGATAIMFIAGIVTLVGWFNYRRLELKYMGPDAQTQDYEYRGPQ